MDMPRSDRSCYRVAVPIIGVLLVPILLALVGCQQVTKVLPKSTWHEKFNWKAEDYFGDPQVVALCRAIEANDIAEIDRLVAAGADANAQGKGNMTPLLWAFPDNKLARFKRLLELGANPNIFVESDFGTRAAIMPGTSVTHLAVRTRFPGYFKAVFDHGGDLNLVDNCVLQRGNTPLVEVVSSPASDKVGRIQNLIGKGADIKGLKGNLAAINAITTWRQFGLALVLLKAGADPAIYQPQSNTKLAHILVTQTQRTDNATWSEQQKTDYRLLVQWLEQHGESLAEAREDLDRWQSWSTLNGEYRRKMAEEVAARKAREAQAKPDADEDADQ